MTKHYSIAGARHNLARLVHEAEAGQIVELTRRGEPVAVVIAADAYARMAGKVSRFSDRLAEFRSQYLGSDFDDVFDDTRDRTAGRDTEIES